MRLTAEQMSAAVARDEHSFIEAHPGSGKTTVAAERFGYHRFAPGRDHDGRAVVATSFTRAATRELRRRVVGSWGSAATTGPHRVVTVDTLFRDALVSLLREGEIEWPGAPADLTVRDSWRSAVETTSTRRRPVVHLSGRRVTPSVELAPSFASRPHLDTYERALAEGICTHDEVRSLVGDSIADLNLRTVMARRLRSNVRALIIDEAFDANELDVAFLELCIDAGVSTTMIGDPWQALYEFRGARPTLVRALVARPDVAEDPLNQSFRWRSDTQRELTEALRTSQGVSLSRSELIDAEVVLADRWKRLWQADPRILPLAFGSARHDLSYAGATLVLNHVTSVRLGAQSPFVHDARATLGLRDPEVIRAAEGWAELTTQRLATDDQFGPREAYLSMATELGRITGRTFPAPHHSRSIYFKWLKPRLKPGNGCVLGLSIHQAKGCEWTRVVVVISDDQVQALGSGLSEDDAGHRALYVACTRARSSTTQCLTTAPQASSIAP